MQTAAILVAVAMLAMVTPISSADEECDNEAYWTDVLTNPAFREPGSDMVVRPDVPVKVGDEDVDIGVVIQQLSDRSSFVCMQKLVDGSAESGDFPGFSTFWSITEIAFDITTQHCNQGANIGDGGHYDVAVATNLGTFPWSPYATGEYKGSATSDISAASSAYYTSGVAIDQGTLSTGKVVVYSGEISYTGWSDFYCIGYFDPAFGDFVTVNWPFLTGTIL